MAIFKISNQALTQLQEVFFDLTDLLNSRELRGMHLKCLEFKTMEEFLQEQIRKLAMIENSFDLENKDGN